MAKKRAKKSKVQIHLIIPDLLVVSLVAAVLYLNYNSQSSMIANPASTKCLSDGGQEKIINNPLGQSGLCMFTDGSVCDTWEYYRGECSKGDCKRVCGQIGTRSEGWYDCSDKLLFYDNCTGENPATAGTC
jgi:putative hemolysin